MVEMMKVELAQPTLTFSDVFFLKKTGRFHFEDPSKHQPKPQIFIHQLIKGLNQYEAKEIGTLVVAASASVPVAATAAYIFSSLFVRLQFPFVAFTRFENGELVCLPSCTFKVDGRGHYLNVQINICFSWASTGGCTLSCPIDSQWYDAGYSTIILGNCFGFYLIPLNEIISHSNLMELHA